MEREVGGGIGMGNTCKPMAVSFQCMTKFTTKKKKIRATGGKKKKRILVGSHSLLQGIFPTQGSNLGFLHCRQIIYHLSYQGSIYSVVEKSTSLQHEASNVAPPEAQIWAKSYL